jgi:hypothetical protein
MLKVLALYVDPNSIKNKNTLKYPYPWYWCPEKDMNPHYRYPNGYFCKIYKYINSKPIVSSNPKFHFVTKKMLNSTKLPTKKLHSLPIVVE